MTDLLKDLNPAQKKAASVVSGPVLILAGAGSGKTKTLTSRIAYLIKEKNIKTENILAVTFTNKAAEEMRNRVKRILKLRSDRALNVSTFHSLCVRILRQDIELLGKSKNFTILDTDEQKTAIKQVMKNLGIDTQKYPPSAILNHISSAKNELIDPAQYDSLAVGHFQKLAARAYPEYQKLLAKNNSLDFDDLLMDTVKLFKQELKILEHYQKLFKYLLIDEYQDTNTAQYQLSKLLAQKHNNIFVVGDDWQSIYSWRGANYRNILNFKKDYPKAKVIKLEENYRSTQNILDAADQIIKTNINRSDKKLWTKRGEGEKISVCSVSNENHEGSFIIQEIIKQKTANPKLEFNDFVVLYRTNAQSRAIEEAFIKNGLPYRVIGGIRFYDRREIKDILAYFKVIANPQDNLSLKRIINIPPKGIGAKTWDNILEFSQQQNKPASEILDQFPASDKVAKKLAELQKMFNKARSWNRNLSALFDYITQATGYLTWLNDKTIEGETRIENVKELKSVIEKYDQLEISVALQIFLEEVSLIQDMDNHDESQDAVTLMTLHSAKGLEFNYVFIAGMEENLFPHSRSLLDNDELEEERRLCYVGITRAKSKVYLIYTQQRMLYGSSTPNAPSRFIDDLPDDLVEDIYSSQFNSKDNFSLDMNDLKTKPIDVEIGDKVQHTFFGTGTVLEINQNELVIIFNNQGTKKLDKQLAPLKKIDK